MKINEIRRISKQDQPNFAGHCFFLFQIAVFCVVYFLVIAGAVYTARALKSIFDLYFLFDFNFLLFPLLGFVSRRAIRYRVQRTVYGKYSIIFKVR